MLLTFKNYLSTTTKSPLVQLRKLFPSTSISLLQQSLKETNQNLDKAQEWLQSEIQNISKLKQEKVQGRPVKEGLVVCVERKGLGSVLLKVNCETDFVARNDLFKDLCFKIGNTVLLSHSHQANQPIPVIIYPNDVLSLPVIQSEDAVVQNFSIGQSIQEAVANLGENIQIQKGYLISTSQNPNLYLQSFMHPLVQQKTFQQNLTASLGKMGAMVCLYSQAETKEQKQNLELFMKQISQHITGLSPADLNELMHQKFLFDQEKSVEEKWKDFELKNKLKLDMECFVRLDLNDELHEREEKEEKEEKRRSFA